MRAQHCLALNLNFQYATATLPNAHHAFQFQVLMMETLMEGIMDAFAFQSWLLLDDWLFLVVDELRIRFFLLF